MISKLLFPTFILIRWEGEGKDGNQFTLFAIKPRNIHLITAFNSLRQAFFFPYFFNYFYVEPYSLFNRTNEVPEEGVELFSILEPDVKPTKEKCPETKVY